MANLDNIPSSVIFSPWIGNLYDSEGLGGRKLLILGESHYGVEGTETAGFTSAVVEKWGLRKRHRFFTITAKLVLGMGSGEHLRDDVRSDFWNRVSFYNFIQEFVGPSPGYRPTTEMWNEAHGPLIKVIEKLKPDALLVLGKELQRHLPTVSDHVSLCAVKHPSRGFRYSDWWPQVQAALRNSDAQAG